MRLAISLMLVAVLSCSKGAKGSGNPVGHAPAALLIVAGDTQVGTVGEELANALVVRVVDSADAPVQGQIVNFKVTEGGGSVFAGAGITNSDGTARERWTLGTAVGAQALEARAVDSQTGTRLVFAIFHATAVAGPTTSITATSGNGQTADANAPLPLPVTTKTVDKFGNGVSGVTVAFTTATSGNGTATPASTLTDSSGAAGSTWTLGSTIGQQTLTATALGLAPAVFQANAVRPPVMTMQPVSRGVSIGEAITFNVSAQGSGLTYQWRKNTVAIGGASGPSYTTTPAVRADGGAAFDVIVMDAYGGGITSTAAIVTIQGFTPTTSMNAPRNDCAAALLPDGKVLLAGGYGTATAERFDPALGTFTPTGAMSSPRNQFTATSLPGGKVLVAGGPGTSAELYDPATGSFSATGSMSVGRYRHTATLLSTGSVLIAGGPGLVCGLASAELYDLGTSSFSTTGGMSTARMFHRATLLKNGLVLVTGGYDANCDATSSAEIYDPAVGTFSATGKMSVGRAQHTSTLLPNGTVLITGGITTGTSFLASAEVYDPTTGTFSLTDSMSSALRDQRAVLLSDGRVLVAGGTAGNSSPVISALAELYDPTAQKFTQTGSMTSGRGQFTATLLLGGKVLVAGGLGWITSTSLGDLASAEVFDPTPNP